MNEFLDRRFLIELRRLKISKTWRKALVAAIPKPEARRGAKELFVAAWSSGVGRMVE